MADEFLEIKYEVNSFEECGIILVFLLNDYCKIIQNIILPLQVL